MSSEPDRAMLREVLGGEREENAGQCSAYTRQQLDAILDRARNASQVAPTTDELLDGVIAPVMYRILFTSAAPDHDYATALLQRTLEH